MIDCDFKAWRKLYSQYVSIHPRFLGLAIKWSFLRNHNPFIWRSFLSMLAIVDKSKQTLSFYTLWEPVYSAARSESVPTAPLEKHTYCNPHPTPVHPHPPSTLLALEQLRLNDLNWVFDLGTSSWHKAKWRQSLWWIGPRSNDLSPFAFLVERQLSQQCTA